jgi:preprotein translocase subunit SecE
MSMNRETKRMLQRQGAVNEAGAPTRTARPPRQKEERASVPEFVREVRAEMRKVAWPTRSEVVNYSIIVLIAVVFVTALVAGLDYLFGSLVLRLFNK